MQKLKTLLLWPAAAVVGLLFISLSGCTALVGATTDEPISPDPTKRSFGTYIDDKQLKTFAEVNLDKTNDAFKNANVEVTVFNGVALITGQVPNKALRDQAARVVNDLDRVRQVHNELEVRSNATFWMNRSDSWIATKVRTKLMANSDVKSSRVKMVVENGAVYLMGLMTRVQAEKASEIAASVGGVTKVVRVVEYIN
ncbi:BON domain-containing protein [Halioxenophilus sp. WMMB6]|uniref:BON domain-containing protein n=1 Tax=Halioxenophilus sp. WMMB6 TaxID=3073815 RepID=UPI00295E8F8A|nr:BON domain-containing protein [Halioxenophilus sp. WMMB6]